jgi:16S rRNA (cytosine1402-N4)-methyltransferase
MTDGSPAGHEPVLAREALALLHPAEGESVLDATLGLGGHGLLFLREIGSSGRLVGLDADAENLSVARERLQDGASRCTFIHANFREIERLDLPAFDVIFADLGVSSPHFDDPKRGFTFRADAPLDLRFDQSKGTSAASWFASATEEEICNVLREYGELREAKRLASALYAEQRRGGGLGSTGAVRTVVEKVSGYRANELLPRVFQALRIAVNDEMGALRAFLDTAPALLRGSGRIGIISYHSLEDRMVKNAFRDLATPPRDPRTGADLHAPEYELLTRKPVVPAPEEIERNPRSRSARFRVLRRVSPRH